MSELASSPVSSEASQAQAPVAEPIVNPAGDSPATWDDLDSSSFKSKSEPKELKKETKELESSKKDSKESKTSKKEVEKPLTPAKLLKLKNGEAELDVAADALVPVKIDGKVIEVPLQEAINRYSQQSHLDKLYKSYKTEKEGFEKQRELMNKALEKSHDYLVNKKDIRGFLEYISEAMGVDADQIYQETVGTLQKQIEEMSALTPEERKIKELEHEVNRFRSKKEAELNAQKEAKSRADLESHVSNVMQTNGMDKAALVQAWDDLTSLGHNPEDITPEFLGAYHANTVKIKTVESKLAEISPDLASNMEIVEALATEAIQTSATSEEIVAAIEQLYGEPPEKKLKKKMDKNERSNFQRGARAVKNGGSDPLFFDDI